MTLNAQTQLLVDLLLEEEGLGDARPEPIPKRGDDERGVVSFAQERLWFLHRLSPSNVSYNVATAVRLTGPLDVPALGRALADVVRRHDALRARFAEVDGRVVAIVSPDAVAPLRVEDARVGPDAPSAESLTARLTAQAREPFDLENGPLVRFHLHLLAPDDHVLLACAHHIVCDGWSMGIITQELGALYAAARAGASAALPPVRVQYGDVAAWQRRQLRGEVLDDHLRFWRGYLGADLPVLALPTDHPRSGSAEGRGASQLERLEAPTWAALRALAEHEGATPFALLLAAFGTLLHRYTGQQEVMIGAPVANRSHPDATSIVGFLVNTLPLRCRFDRDPMFRDALRRICADAREALAHQDLPLERIVEEVVPQRSARRSTAFQAMLVLQNVTAGMPAMDGIRVERVRLPSATSKLDLNLKAEEERDGTLSLELEYDSSLFEAETARRMSIHLLRLLREVARDPGRRVSELGLLDAAEEDAVLRAWNRTAQDYPPAEGFHRLVEAQAARTPARPAVACGDEVLTYAELEERANRLARYLRSVGVDTGSVVAVDVPRSTSLLVALLSVMKAGGAFLPLDASTPPVRMQRLLAAARARTLLTTEERLPTVPLEFDGLVVPIELALRESRSESAAPLDGGAAPDDLAYVLFTSGSTGTPKAVAVTHAAIVNYVRAVTDRLELDACAAFAHVSIVNADLGHTVLLPPLTFGGCVHLVPQQLIVDPAGLADYFERHAIDCVKIAPSHLQTLLLGPRPAQVLPRRLLVLGGEHTSAQLLDRVGSLAPDCRVAIHYGPTETTVGVTVLPLPRPVTGREGTAPIGRPLANCRVYVLDGHLRPSPVGVVGELYVAGRNVARGYLGAPAATAERFLPDPFGGDGGRMYRTGDLARWRDDGTLQLLGRLDRQVKVRGFRVELGEVEAVLLRQRDVVQAVVVALPGASGETSLAAFVVFSATDLAQPEVRLREALRRELPPPMIPSSFVRLERLPLLPSGKVDLKALPAMLEQARSLETPAAAATPPASRAAEQIVAVWRELLGAGEIGLDDNFFDLGGHSILAIQAMARLQKVLGIEIPLVSLFESPTVRELATHVERMLATGEAIGALHPAPVARDRDLPLSFGQRRLWFLQTLEPDSPAYNMIAVLRAVGALDVAALESALTAIAERHEVLRTTYAQVDGRPVQRIRPVEPCRVPVVDLRAVPEDSREAECARIVGEESRTAFDLENGPILRARVLRLADDRHVLFVASHHIACDGWSVGIILRELAALYGAFSARTPAALPPLALQYADFAVWQRRRLQGALFEQQLGYWQRKLAELPPGIALPTDRPRPPQQSYVGGAVEFRLGRDVLEGAKRVARENDATVFMVLLAAFQALLSRYSGQLDIPIGTPVAGRTDKELEHLVGFFVNTLVLRTDLSGEPSFAELVRRVRTVALEAYANQDLPFEALVERVGEARDLGRTPLFQVMFVYHNIPDLVFTLPGLKLAVDVADVRTAKFDLTLALQEWDGGLLGSLEYSADLFDEATIRRMVGHLEVVLRDAVAHPEKRLSGLELITPEERATVLALGTGREAAGGAASVLAAVRAHAEHAPQRVAVASGTSSLTYGELALRADRIAAALRRRGVGPEHVAVVLDERGGDLVAALVGILGARAAYLPLDPAHPMRRHAEVIAASGAHLVLVGDARRNQLHQLAEAVGRDDVRFCAIRELLAEQDAPAPALLAPSPSDLAYVIYTSGSTGRPKGAMVELRGLLNNLRHKIEDLELTSGDVVAQTASQSFDISVWQLLAALLVGGRVEIVPDDVVRDPRVLLAHAAARGVTVLEIVPSLLRAVLDLPQASGGARAIPASLRRLSVTGEAAPPETCRRWFEATTVPVMNAYGPAECSDDVACHVLTSAPDGASVPIGRPIANLRLHVVDVEGQLVPAGIPGEIVVGGAGVGRGYLGDPAQTAQAFVPDPLAPAPGARAYRTGDVGRWRPDGSLEFLGRVDHQVKLRGYRIELGEIERALLSVTGVAEAVVVLDQSGDPRLVAYVAPAPGAPIDGGTVRDALKQVLPSYMVPAACVVIPRLPLTANGKIDRGALPKVPAPALERRDEAPARTRVEHELAEIWREALNLASVGITDDFFALGGHSLLAVKLMARIEERLGVELPISSLFRGPTIEHQAALITASANPEFWSPLVAVQPRGTRLPFFAVHPTGGDVLCYHGLSRLLGADQPFYALQARGIDGVTEPTRDLPAMAADYLEAVRRIRPHGPYLLGGWSFGGTVAFEMARQLREAGEPVALVAIFDSLAPIPADGMAEVEQLGGLQWAKWFKVIATELERVFRVDLAVEVEELRDLPPERQLQAFIDRLARVQFLPAGGGRSLTKGFWRVHEANCIALWNYALRPRPYDGTAVLFRSEEDLLLQESWDRAAHANRTLGWERVVVGGLTTVQVAGDHNRLLSSPFVETLAAELRKAIDAVGRAEPSGLAAADASPGERTRGAEDRGDRTRDVEPAAALPPHLIGLPGARGEWAMWRCHVVRGAGFPVDAVLGLGCERLADEAGAVVDAERARAASQAVAFEAVRARLGALGNRGAWDDDAARAPLLNALRRLQSGRPLGAAAGELAPELQAYRAACAAHAAAEARFRGVYETEVQQVSARLVALARDERLQEAILWQNRRALHTGVRKLVAPGARMDSQQRQREQLVAAYLQRYCTKNDSIGFFGPVGWGRFTEEPIAIAATPGPTLLAKRTVYHEAWCVDALAQRFTADPDLARWMPARRAPNVSVVGGQVITPWDPPLDLPPPSRALLELCDGARTPVEIAQSLVRAGAGWRSEREVLLGIQRLQAIRLVDWSFRVPLSPRAADTLRRAVGRIDDEALRSRCLAPLERLEEGRRRIAAAAGDIARLDDEMRDLDSAFEALTGEQATRLAGRTYAARTLVYEDCVRDLDVRVGEKVLASMGPALSLVLRSARWFTWEIAREYRRVCGAMLDELRQESGEPHTDGLRMWHRMQPLMFGEQTRIIDRVRADFQQRWSAILRQASHPRSIQWRSRDLEEAVAAAFDAPEPGWRVARYHSPDVMIAARSVEDVERGDYLAVLGEVHLAANTVNQWVFMGQHPDLAAACSWLEQDLPPRIAPVSPKKWPTLTTRTQIAYISPKDVRLVATSAETDVIDGDSLPMTAARVLRKDGGVVVQVGDLELDVVELFADALTYMANDSFSLLKSVDHRPRICIDKLVVCREAWRVAAADLTWAADDTPERRFLGAARWRTALGVPRFVFMKSPVEKKPAFIDLSSPIYVEAFAKVVRRTMEARRGDGRIALTEMLPTPDAVWLTDAEGRRFTSELRMVAVDQIPTAPSPSRGSAE